MKGTDMGGKQIRIFLVNGEPSGILTAEIMNWTGKTIVAPRTMLSELGQREEVKRTGIYCLVGPDPEFPHRDRLYVGEGDSVFTRLKDHDKDETKDFWTRVACVTSKDANITKSHGRYLESRMISLALEAGRAAVSNGTAPAVPPLPEPDIADMEYFLDQVKLIFPVLGFNFLQPKAEVAAGTGVGLLKFVMKDVGAKATAVETAGEFVVLKGSTARKQGNNSWQSYVELRKELVAGGKLVDSPDPDYLVFTEDIPFDSPSAAAAVVAGGNRNGRKTWRLEATNQTYGDWQEAKIALATNPSPSGE